MSVRFSKAFAKVDLDVESELSNLAGDANDSSLLDSDDRSSQHSNISYISQIRQKVYPYIPVILCMIYTIPMVVLFASSFIATKIVFGRRCTEDGAEFDLQEVQFIVVATVLSELFIFLGFPFAGWLADTKIGRLKCVTTSLWFLWLSMIFLVAGSLLSAYPECNTSFFTYYTGLYVLLPVSVIFMGLAATVFFPNILAFILDQLVDVSNSVLNSVMRWFTWVLFVGIFFGYLIIIPGTLQPLIVADNLPVISIWMAVFCSGILILHFYAQPLFQDHIPKGPMNSPYKILFDVLKYAWNHKFPVNRSALTYWEEDIPKRIDLAKEKYGGPYTTENVEDVKTFMRIMAFILAMFVYYLPYAAISSETVPFLQHLHHITDLQYRQWIVYLLEPLVTIICIPILELVILILFPKFEYMLMKSFLWIGLGMVAIVVSTFSFLIIDVVSHVTSVNQTTDICFFQWHVNDATDSLSYGWVSIPTFLWGVSDLLVTPSIFCFICRQAPYKMRGMLFGSFMLMQQIAFFFGTQIGTIFIAIPKGSFPISCGLFYWGIQLLLSVLGVITFIVAAKLYHFRERQEIEQHVRIIESIFDRQLNLQEKYEALSESKLNIVI